MILPSLKGDNLPLKIKWELSEPFKYFKNKFLFSKLNLNSNFIFIQKNRYIKSF